MSQEILVRFFNHVTKTKPSTLPKRTRPLKKHTHTPSSLKVPGNQTIFRAASGLLAAGLFFGKLAAKKLHPHAKCTFCDLRKLVFVIPQHVTGIRNPGVPARTFCIINVHVFAHVTGTGASCEAQRVPQRKRTHVFYRGSCVFVCINTFSHTRTCLRLLFKCDSRMRIYGVIDIFG